MRGATSSSRLQFYISEMSKEVIVEKLYITTDTLDRVLSGQLTLSRHRVADLARKLGQPEDEYLILAGYVPQNAKRILLNPGFLNLVRISSRMSNGELWRIGLALNSIYLLYTLPGGKKGKAMAPPLNELFLLIWA
jgi:hypothetical protein